jgi:biopolymer transport protein ExbD
LESAIMGDFLDDSNAIFHFEPEPEEAVGLNITPMVDVIFILLVFFLCVSQLKAGKLEIQLPEVDKLPQLAQSKNEQEPIVVELSLDGRIAVGKIEYKSFEPIEERLKKLVQEGGKDQHIVVRADRKLEYQNVTRVLSMIYNVGLYKLDLHFESRAKTP